jgi:hypothetical protein
VVTTVLTVRTKSVRPPEAFVFVSREFVYQYNGKASLQDEPELVRDTVSIPAPDTLVRRHGTNYKVISVSVTNARATFPRFIINLRPLDEFPSD